MQIVKLSIRILLIFTLLAPGLTACGGGGGATPPPDTSTPPPVTIPASPTGLVATAKSTSSIDLSWSDNSNNESNFELQRSISSGSGFAVIATLGANTTSYADITDLSPSTAYFYQVKASNSAGDSGFSNEANATTVSEPVTGIPLSAGKKWLYNFQRTETVVGSTIGVRTTNFTGEALLHVENETGWQGRQAWRVVRYELERAPTGDDAFDAKVEYLFQDANGLEKWDGSEWKRILSTQLNSFADNALLFTRDPNSRSTTTLSQASVSVPAGTFTTVRANAKYREGFTNFAPVDHNEDHSEYYADDIGLVRSVWDFDFDDNDPNAFDVFEDGVAELAAIDSGPSFPGIATDTEPNDASTTAQALPGSYSIVAGTVHIDDAGEVVSDTNVFANISGAKKLEDWYGFEHVGGPLRLDLKYQSFSNGNFNDLDVYLFRKETNGTLTFINRSTNDPTVAGDRELIESSLTTGTYLIAIQAWNTPTNSIEYWYVIR